MNDPKSARSTQFALAALALGLFATISAWIVSAQGESYRQAIAGNAGPRLIAQADPPEPPPPAPSPAPVINPPRVISPPPAPQPQPQPQPIVAPPVAPTPVALAPAPIAPPTPKVAVAPPPVASPSPPDAGGSRGGPKLDPFWDEPDQTKVWDLDRLTTEGEQALGAALHRMILHADAELDNGPLPKRVADAARPYLNAVTRKGVEYTFTVLDSPRMNVFSTPGGYIYVTRGLFDWIAEDEDYALGFILAHEIAHVDMAHAITCLRDPEVKQKFKFGTVLLFYAVMIPAGYLKQQDFDADRWAATQMLKAGRSRYETLAFLRRLEDYARAHSFENKRKNPRDTPEVPLLDNHIRAHPIPRDRLEQLKLFLDRQARI